MARKHLSYYLDNLSRLEEITVEELQDWQKEYPYVQNLKFLMAKKQQQISNKPDKDSLQQASVYSADRTFLYKQIEKETKEVLPVKIMSGSKAPKAAVIAGAAAITTGVAVKKKKNAKEVKKEKPEKTKGKSSIKGKSKSKSAQAKVEVKKEKTRSKNKLNTKKTSTKATVKKSGEKKKPVNLKYDNFRKLEGIGPKIEKLLYASNIRTYKQLAASTQNRLTKTLSKGGSRYKSHNPTTWPKQAALAASGKWDQLKKLQDKIEGGKLKSAKKATIKKSVKANPIATKKAIKSDIKRVKKVTTTPTTKKKAKKKTIKPQSEAKTKEAPKKKSTHKKKVTKTKVASKPLSKTKKTTVAKAKKTVAKQSASKTKASLKKAVASPKSKSKSPSTKNTKAKKKSGSSKKTVTKSRTGNARPTKSKKTSIKASSNGKEESVSSFSQWLMSLRSEEKKHKKQTPKSKKTNKNSNKTDKKIKASVKNKDKVVSESLAKLLAKQGHHIKAKNMYKKLSLLFPQKSAYFAAQIDKLKSSK